MKKIIHSLIFMIIFHTLSYSQKHVRAKLIIPQKFISSSFTPLKKPTAFYSFKGLNNASQPVNKVHAFIAGLPQVKIKETAAKRSTLFFTELSFPDIFEDILKNTSRSLVNGYDDDLPELFKDAPSRLKISFKISL